MTPSAPGKRITEVKDLLVQLQKLFTFWDPSASLEDNLRVVIEKAASIVGAERFVFAIAGAERTWRAVPHGVTDVDMAVDLTAVHECLLAADRSMLLSVDGTRELPEAAARDGASVAGLLAAPIKIGGDLVGFVCMRPGANRQSFDLDAVVVLDIVSTFIAASMQAIHLQNVLRSRFAQIALARTDHNVVRRAVPLPNQMAKILAKTFYSEMTKAGFGSGEIISVASEIIAQLSNSVRRHRARMETASREELGREFPRARERSHP
jgi:hypothetical protein